MRAKRWILYAFLLVTAGCRSGENGPSQAAEDARPTSSPVAWATARDAAGLPLLEAPATVVAPAAAEASVTPPARTRVEEVYVQVGDRVEKGEPLARVVMPEVLEAAGRLAAAKIRIEAQSRRREQLLSLREHGLTRSSDLAETEAALAEARAERMAARALLGGAGLSEAEGTALLERQGSATLRSPIAGIVLAVDASIGSVHESAGNPLFRIGAASTGRVVARMSASLPDGATFVWIAPGQPQIPLELRAESPLVDPRDGSRELFFDAEESLQPGATGKVRILLPEGSRVVAIPLRAVFMRDDRTFVHLRGPEGVREAEVRVVSTSGSEALVEGLDPGARVASDAGRYAASLASGEEEEP